MAILDRNRTYYFSEFSEFPQPPEEILGGLGYALPVEALALPTTNQLNYSLLEQLKSSLALPLQLTPLTSEQARREALVSPILFTN